MTDAKMETLPTWGGAVHRAAGERALLRQLPVGLRPRLRDQLPAAVGSCALGGARDDDDVVGVLADERRGEGTALSATRVHEVALLRAPPAHLPRERVVRLVQAQVLLSTTATY
jgi:hypothetical protein